MDKDQVKSEVVKKLDAFCKERFEEIEFQTEGSLTDTYKYMSLSNVNDALEKCFEETYKLLNK